jgi:hypothetical protein
METTPGRHPGVGGGRRPRSASHPQPGAASRKRGRFMKARTVHEDVLTFRDSMVKTTVFGESDDRTARWRSTHGGGLRKTDEAGGFVRGLDAHHTTGWLDSQAS